ncbi:hypothetical protein BX285_2586 [Streptomyces sp. 1114.5]|uniref:hypothetical protein n=1 Tax=Streptomyces sp. 1114.5 TaxID=1938830 RepID=UPI000EAC15BE|nr:hypothetical protein [Streptomyces sp. 1114.5]RKT18169.1 hypothetical protein BX285_2586 [Streptomyces sp. 1114.5]
MSTVTARQNTTRQNTTLQTPARQAPDRRSATEADGLAIASFLLGLPGLLLFNIVLGPIAITLATLALVRGTNRRGRAVLGLVLGVASLALLAVTTATSHGVLMDFGS